MIGTLIGAGIGMMNTAINNELAAERTAWDRQQNYLYGEMSANNADKRTRALYNDIYSPKALLQQYLDAGLSPSLMFGGTPGQGGMSGAQGNGGAGIQTPFMPISAIEAATIGKTLAETQKTKAETKTIEQKRPLELQEQAERIKLIVQETGNKELEASQLALQNVYQDYQNQMFWENAENNIKIVGEQLNLLKEQVEQARTQNKISKESADSIIEYNKQMVYNIMADSFLKNNQAKLAQENIKLTKAQTASIIAHIFLDSADIQIKKGQLEVNKSKVEKEIEKMCSEIGLLNQQQKVIVSKHVLEWITGIGGTVADIIKAIKGM